MISRPRRAADDARSLLGFFGVFVLVYLLGFYNLDTAAGLSQFVKGFAKFVIHFVFLALAVAWLSRRGVAYYWRALDLVLRRDRGERRLRRRPARSPRRPGRTSTRLLVSRSPAARARSTSTAPSTARRSTARTRSPATRTTSGSC